MADKLITTSQLLQMLAKYNHKELHVHHTWRPNHSNFNGSNYQKVQDGMRRSHLGRGFVDIAQHVTLFPDGMFMTGRDFGQNPASISGYNRGAFCVEMVGDFDKGQDKFEGKQKEAMLSLARFFDLQGKYIRFHRENAPKTCPGTSIDKNHFMSEVRQFVKGASVKKEEPILSEKDFATLNQSQRESIERVLHRLSSDSLGDQALSKGHVKSFKDGKLSLEQLVANAFVAIDRSLFKGPVDVVDMKERLEKLEKKVEGLQ